MVPRENKITMMLLFACAHSKKLMDLVHNGNINTVVVATSIAVIAI
jgi:hypothetical protein